MSSYQVFWSAGPLYSAEERRAMHEAEEKCQIQVSAPFMLAVPMVITGEYAMAHSRLTGQSMIIEECVCRQK